MNYVDDAVTEVVTTQVRPGKERAYLEWAQRIHAAEAGFPGYRGGFLQPAADRKDHWTTMVRFATPEQLATWLNSDERRTLLEEHAALVQSWEHHRMPSAFAGWFAADSATGSAPAAWKQSMLVVLVLFPIVMLELRFLSPLLATVNSAVVTFVGNVVSVTLLAWPCMPLVIRAMRWWLLPQTTGPGWINPAGAVLLLALYAFEIAVFSRSFQ